MNFNVHIPHTHRYSYETDRTNKNHFIFATTILLEHTKLIYIIYTLNAWKLGQVLNIVVVVLVGTRVYN